jgi:hypothetical protein
MGLPVHDHRIDAPSDIIDRCIALYLDRTSLGIDFALAYRASIGKDRVVHFVDGRDAQASAKFLGQHR